MLLQEESRNKEKISAKIVALEEKTPSLAKAIATWKSQLEDDYAFQHFNWKADVAESWIGMMVGNRVPWAEEFLIELSTGDTYTP